MASREILESHGGEAIEMDHAERPGHPGSNTSSLDSSEAISEPSRRETAISFSAGATNYANDTTPSIYNSRSPRNKIRAPTSDETSNLSKKGAEPDTHNSHQNNSSPSRLHIDFNYLESLAGLDKDTDAFRATASNETGVDGGLFHLLPNRSKSQPVDNSCYYFFSSANDSINRARNLDGLLAPGQNFRTLFDQADENGMWWLDVHHASKEKVQHICQAFGVHPLTIEDILMEEAREKIEMFPSYYFACFRSFHIIEGPEEKQIEPLNISVIVFQNGALSFSFTPNPHASNVRERIFKLKDHVALSSDWICYALIDDIVDTFHPVIREVEIQAEAIDDQVFAIREDDSSTFFRSIVEVRKNCTALSRLLSGKADVLRGFTKRHITYPVSSRMDISIYLTDIQDHIITMEGNLSHSEKVLSRAHSNYLATISISSISQGNNTNRVLGKIIVLSSIFVPSVLISSLFGMNINVPFQGTDTLAPFFGIIGVMVLVCSVIIALARIVRWI